MFAGTTPAPGGAFTHAAFERRPRWGPALVDAPARLGVRLESEREVGWSVEVTCVVEDVVDRRRGARIRTTGPTSPTTSPWSTTAVAGGRVVTRG